MSNSLRMAVSSVMGIACLAGMTGTLGAAGFNPDLSSFGKEGAAWIQAKNLGKGMPGSVEPAQGRESSPGLKLATPRGSLNLGAVQQAVKLEPGLYEFCVWAKGQGDLVLRCGPSGRNQPLGADWAFYGYLFDAKEGESLLTIGVVGESVHNPFAVISSPELKPASEEQKAAWAKQEDSFRQFGFYTSSAQRPAPGVKREKEREARSLEKMNDMAAFWDDRIDCAHSKNVKRLLEYLKAAGVRILNSEELAAWMRSFIGEDKDAYGSSCVMPMGATPCEIFEMVDGSPLWFRYLLAGGRIVNGADVPFYSAQSASCEPFNPPDEGQGSRLLGLKFGWHSAYWGQGLAVTPTEQGKKWGFETVGASVTGFDAETVSIAFSTYDVPEVPGRPGAASWFKNFRPDMPWSGLIQLHKSFDGNNDAQVRDVMRALAYVGRPVDVPQNLPPMIEALVPPMEIVASASGISGREEFARGEKVQISVVLNKVPDAKDVKLELMWDGKVLQSWNKPPADNAGKKSAEFELDTSPLAYGTYKLAAKAEGGESPQSADLEIGVRHVPPESFAWGIWIGNSESRKRRDLLIRKQTDIGMEPHLVDHEVALLDAVLRQNAGFNIRMGQENHVTPKTGNPAQFYRIEPDWKSPHKDNAYGGGRPMVGITHPDVLAATKKAMSEYYTKFAQHPAFRPRISCNDDFSIRYGFDFAEHVRAKFKALTGSEPPGPFEPGKDPLAQIKIPPMGIVPDDEPWRRWCMFTLEHVSGEYNTMQTEAVTGVRPDSKIGPIPGGMQIPLIQMWSASQYPPLNFGRKGFNLGYCYYYNTYWQPVITNSYWLEVNRMCNRDMDLWLLADCMGYALYHRNNLYHLLAGGAKGIPYFVWSQTRPEAWREIKRQAPVIRRIAPVQFALKADRRRIGLLVPITADCYSPTDHLIQPYAYANLMMGHFDVEPVAEEEVASGEISGRYDAIALYYVRWLPKSVADGLAKFAKDGGKVILDPTIPFEIPGAVRLKVDIGMGQEQTKGVPDGQAHLSTPGIRDYGMPERIRAVAAEMEKHVRPLFRSPDTTLTACTFKAGGVSYFWFVNTQSGEEYRVLRPLGCGYGSDGFEKALPWITELENSRFVSPVAMEKIPGVPYDLCAGRRIPVDSDGTAATFNVSMERMGGALVAFYPEEIAKLELAAPSTARPMEETAVAVKVSGKGALVPGAVPIRLDIVAPDGKISPLSGNYATKDGVFELKWTPAVNDMKGAWKIKAEELAGGNKCEASVNLQN